jgi:hypothetical protein
MIEKIESASTFDVVAPFQNDPFVGQLQLRLQILQKVI